MRRAFLATMAALSVLLGVLPGAEAAPFSTPIERVAGADRTATSIEVSRLGWDASPQVVLATGLDFPDALGATPLAASLGAPLLLLPGGHLREDLFAEIQRLGAQSATILGGANVVSPQVENELAARGITARRLSGPDRYATAAAAAVEAGRSPKGQAVVASGEFFADALSAGSLAAGPDRLPVLLSSMHDVPDVTMAALAELGVAEVMLIGGTGILGPSVEQELVAAGIRVARFAGTDRFATSARVATDAFARLASNEVPLVMAAGTTFPDALAAGPLLARIGGVLLLVPPSDLGIDPEGVRFVRDRLSRLTNPLLLGGTSAVNGIVEWQMRAVLEGDAVPAAAFADGVHRLAAGFPPGTYRTLGSAAGCYWERLRGFSGHPSDIIANDLSNDPMTVTVAPTDAGFRVSGCSIWTADLTPEAIVRAPADRLGDGTWLVGAEVQPGVWTASGGTTCFWERLSGFSGELADVVQAGDAVTVTIEAGDLGFRSRRCGTWSLTG